ncbi:LysR family transcriptional regulator [Paraburkholderia sp. MMS20-SJTN17]|uniref:LysR family transcriptional regulator n=1 Tax=Paraburkholderia translucens TaxID=2886945 RepID=A0ABS8KIP5_9BURK|nr:LysR family transcriptional regulator [Paraburkholderia sp. MMS20-SJTN17]MCC8404640.1 LysR family transcriptional regulator [Paraburkholderia sp. MMS20-SJTN17]
MDQLYMLRAFIETARHRSFTRASEVLGVTPGVISKAISQLESEIQTRLFHRTTRSVTLTDEAETYFETCTRILAELTEATYRLRCEREADGGPIRIAVHPTLASDWLAQFLSEYRSKAPNVNLTVSVEERAIGLSNGSVDLAILPTDSVELSTMIRRSLTSTSNVFVASPEYLRLHGKPERANELSQHPLLLPQQMQSGSGTIELLEDGKAVTVATGPTLASEVTVVHAAALAGAGVALLPDAAMRNAIRTGELVQILMNCSVLEGDMEISLFYPYRDMLPLRMRVFVDFCIDFFRTEFSGKSCGTAVARTSQNWPRVELPVAA